MRPHPLDYDSLDAGVSLHKTGVAMLSELVVSCNILQWLIASVFAVGQDLNISGPSQVHERG